MLRLCWMTPLGLALSLLAGGCASTSCPTPPCQAVSHAPSLEETGTEVGRGQIGPDLRDVPTLEAVEAALGRAGAEAPTYYALTAHQCQCLAVAHVAMADAIDAESELSQRSAGDRNSTGRAAALQSKLLSYRALEERNNAAAEALELFYRLAEAEASYELLGSSLAEIERAIEDCRDLEAKGMKLDADPGALSRKRIAMLDRQARLRASMAQLNAGLRQRLGSQAGARTRVWPLVDLEVTPAPVDVERVVAEGLACRTDVGSLRLMLDSVDDIGIRALRKVMGSIDGALGTARSRPTIFVTLLSSGGRPSYEREVRRRQIATILASREGASAAEIRTAAEEVETHLRQIALARQQRDSWQQRLEDLKARRAADGVTAFDVSAAQLELYQAKADLISQAVAWRIAEVKIRKAQNVLPLECGLSLPAGACKASCCPAR